MISLGSYGGYSIRRTSLERDVLQSDTWTIESGHACPVLVDIQAVCGVAGDEVLEENVRHRAGATVALDHVGLVTTNSVDVASLRICQYGTEAPVHGNSPIENVSDRCVHG